MVMYIFTAGGSIFRQNPHKAFIETVVSHLKETIGSTGVLSGEHMMHGLVSGLDKVSISMHCYVAASHSRAMLQSRCL